MSPNGPINNETALVQIKVWLYQSNVTIFIHKVVLFTDVYWCIRKAQILISKTYAQIVIWGQKPTTWTSIDSES